MPPANGGNGPFTHHPERRGAPQGLSDLRDHALTASDRDPASRQSFDRLMGSSPAEAFALRRGIEIATCEASSGCFPTKSPSSSSGDLRRTTTCARCIRLARDHLGEVLPRLILMTAKEWHRDAVTGPAGRLTGPQSRILIRQHGTTIRDGRAREGGREIS